MAYSILANSPLVPFAAIMGFSWVSDPQRILCSKRIFGLAIMAITFIAMITMLQRAPLILTTTGVPHIIRIALTPPSLFIRWSLAPLSWRALLPVLSDHYRPFTIHEFIRHSSVGFNNRIEEFQSLHRAIIFLSVRDGVTLWQSPAVADMWVRFTHNTISLLLV